MNDLVLTYTTQVEGELSQRFDLPTNATLEQVEIFYGLTQNDIENHLCVVS